MIDNDGAVASNFQRLVSQALEDVFDPTDGSVTLDEFKESVIGDIRIASLGFSLTLSSIALVTTGRWDIPIHQRRE